MSGNQEEPLSIEESKELMGRIAQLQQDKATLEERVCFSLYGVLCICSLRPKGNPISLWNTLVVLWL